MLLCDTLDSNLKNKEVAVKREAIINYQDFIWSSFISHYPDSGDAMYRLLFNQDFNLLVWRCEKLANFRKFEKFQTNHFLPLLQCRRSKVNTNSKPSAKKMRMEFLEWTPLSTN